MKEQSSNTKVNMHREYSHVIKGPPPPPTKQNIALLVVEFNSKQIVHLDLAHIIHNIPENSKGLQNQFDVVYTLFQRKKATITRLTFVTV